MAGAPSTPDALLDAAEALFSDRGYAAVGIREIVDRAGVNLAAVTYHFGGKSELYRAVVRRALERRRTAEAWRLLDPAPVSRPAAAEMLARFIHLFLRHLLSEAESQRVCRLIVHEAAEPTGAMEFVVRDFIRPHERKLTSVLAILMPRSDDRTLALHAQSVLGQLLHYHTYRPFLERIDLVAADDVRGVADHIARFSLRGIGCSPRLVESACSAALDYDLAIPSGGDP